MIEATLFDPPVMVERGQIWQLGNHRLMCGDSTSPEDVSALFAGDKYSLCFTSPPYSDQRTYKIGAFDWHKTMCGAFDQLINYGMPDCHVLVNLGLVHKNRQVDFYWLDWLMYAAGQGWPLFGWYVWDKGAGMPRDNHGRLMSSHEFIFHFTKKGLANKWVKTLGHRRIDYKFRQKDGSVKKPNSPDAFGQPFKIPDSVIRIGREASRGIHTANHPAVFPVALPEFIMQTWSQPGNIVYEPFCGSGTSILAAENLQRRCYSMEIEPSYCELAIHRWQRHTSQSARLIG